MLRGTRSTCALLMSSERPKKPMDAVTETAPTCKSHVTERNARILHHVPNPSGGDEKTANTP